MTDFLGVAKPLLHELANDPKRGAPNITETTTFPLGGHGIEGEAVQFSGDGEFTGSIPVVDEDSVETARSANREAGLDTLAFYKSFRFAELPPFAGKWGIFLLDAGIAAITVEYQTLNATISLAEARSLAVATLLAHERYHFWIDMWAFGQEILPFIRYDLVKKYEYYIAERQESVLTAYDFEESFANYYAYRQLRNVKLSGGPSTGRIVRLLFQNSPEPYSNFMFDSETRLIKEGTLASAVCNGDDPTRTYVGRVLRSESEAIRVVGPIMRPALKSAPFANDLDCPIFQVRSNNYAACVQPFQRPVLKEFRAFIERYLRGEKLDRTDHDYYKIDNGEKVEFPNPHHKEVRRDELKGTLLKAGMTYKEFVQARISTSYWQKHCPRDPVKPALISE